jgi:hypothetical protein
MKNFLYIILILIAISCHENKDKNIENKIQGLKVSAQAKESNLGNPPSDNPLILELLSFKEADLNRVDQLYIKTVNETKDQEYIDNLKQIGFKVIILHGLIETGTLGQKQYYINEQMNSKTNLPNISDFFALLESVKGNFSKIEIIDLGNKFYNKNLKVLERLNFPDEKVKKSEILNLKQKYKMFQRNIATLKN